jgi:hypothetical protein
LLAIDGAELVMVPPNEIQFLILEESKAGRSAKAILTAIATHRSIIVLFLMQVHLSMNV